MTILYIHQYFETPEESGRTRSYWFAKKLLEAGHKVLVITGTHSHSRRVAGVYNIEGIEVRYLSNAYDNKMSVTKKVLSFLKFMLLSTKYVMKESEVNLVYATSTPLTVGIPALLRKWIKGTPYIFEVRDLWPEFPIQIGVIKNRLLIRLLRIMERTIYKNAKHVVALSPGMSEGVIKAGIAENSVTVIPNMSKPDLFFPRPHNQKVKEKYGLESSDLKVIHFGTMGVANGLEYIIDAAEVLQEKQITGVQIYFAGKGAMENKLKEICQRKRLKNVHFLGFMNTYEISDVVNCCDVTLTTFKDIPILQTNSPNKLFDSFSAGKPSIVNSAGWTKDLVENAECGLFVNPKDPERLAQALIELMGNPLLVNQMGANARELALKVYDKSILSSHFLAVIEANT